ncbi:F-box/LRR-repeat protein 20-like [Lingula anatina]|uniref:F-box/LRR-repeat protein 20-like n=1 Tax=Lingula anatina TaxID=7574 RepID=A0A1S3JK93_LINAN|nr:F-box/LRR-repeat protein 20-like [Lingula anatina]|eukprot:XP_013410840.1 F-box/LRR-repeat protein 20-like [Lingula anatina]
MDSSFLSVRCVCRRLFNLMKDRSLWYRDTLEAHNDLPPKLLLQVMGMSSNMLTHLDTSFCLSVTDEFLACLISKCRRLCHINIAGCSLVTDAAIRLVADAVKNLRTLIINECRLITCGAILDAVTAHKASLQRLEMARCLGMRQDPYKVGYIAEHCANVKYLNICWFSNYSEHAPILDMDVCKYAMLCPFLVSLDLGHTHATDHCLEVVAGCCKNLETLSMAQCFVTDVGLTKIGRGLNKMKSLNLADGQHFGDAGMFTIYRELKALEYLNLTRCFRLTNQCIQNVLIELPALKTLILKQCYKLDDSGLHHLLIRNTSPRLYYLDASSTLITKALIDRIRQARQQLVINYQDCPYTRHVDCSQWGDFDAHAAALSTFGLFEDRHSE